MSAVWDFPAGDATARRLLAAQALGGYRSARAMALDLNRDGLSYTTLVAIAARRRGLMLHEAAYIAKACGIPARFFEADFFDAEPSPGENLAEAIADRDYHRDLAARAMELARLAHMERLGVIA